MSTRPPPSGQIVLAAAAIATIAGPEAVARQIEQAPRGTTLECPIRATFGSHATGIDRETFEAVKRHVEASPDIERAVIAPFGREGDLDLCVFPRPGAEAAVEASLRALLPAPGGPRRRGWVKLTVTPHKGSGKDVR